MIDRVDPAQSCIREAVCIHTKKIYDSCRDKDCVEDLRVYPTRSSQAVLDRTASVRGTKAELLCVDVDVEPASYNRGYYTTDIRYYYRITADAYCGGSRPAEIQGLAVFDKRVTLFGSEGSAMIFSSRDKTCAAAGSNLPEAVVEAVDPIVLSARVVDPCDFRPGHRPGGPGCGPDFGPDFGPGFGPGCGPRPDHGPRPDGDCRPGREEDDELRDVPAFISDVFDNELTFGGGRRLYVTLGQFSLVRLERDSQLMIPMYDYCMPTRECSASDDDDDADPCEAFRQIRFPVGEFFPPSALPGMEDDRPGCGCSRSSDE